jgi:hypothetical protein
MLTMDCDAEALDFESKVSGSRLSHLIRVHTEDSQVVPGGESGVGQRPCPSSRLRETVLLGMGENRTMSGAQRTQTGEYLAEGRTLPLRGLRRSNHG